MSAPAPPRSMCRAIWGPGMPGLGARVLLTQREEKQNHPDPKVQETVPPPPRRSLKPVPRGLPGLVVLLGSLGRGLQPEHLLF